MLTLDKRYAKIIVVLLVAVTATITLIFFERIASKTEMTEVYSGIDKQLTDKSIDHTRTYQYMQYVERMSNINDMDINQSEVQASIRDLSSQEENQIVVNVWRQETNTVEAVSLEDYVLAVTMSEIPWSFKDEAVKAQMIASRTYILYRLKLNEGSEKEYDITDSTKHQVYRQINKEDLSEKENEALKRFKALLQETTSQVITYDNTVIDALYFSTSNNYTESAEQYFNRSLPYLNSVKSEWDREISPSYEKQVTYSYEEIISRLNRSNLLQNNSSSLSIDIIERSKSNRVSLVSVNNIALSGRQFRELLELASTDFNVVNDTLKKTISITTKGYGHGVGMSQWGAEGMAREGYSYMDILKHYYTNIEVKSL